MSTPTPKLLLYLICYIFNPLLPKIGYLTFPFSRTHSWKCPCSLWATKPTNLGIEWWRQKRATVAQRTSTASVFMRFPLERTPTRSFDSFRTWPGTGECWASPRNWSEAPVIHTQAAVLRFLTTPLTRLPLSPVLAQIWPRIQPSMAGAHSQRQTNGCPSFSDASGQRTVPMKMKRRPRTTVLALFGIAPLQTELCLADQTDGAFLRPPHLTTTIPDTTDEWASHFGAVIPMRIIKMEPKRLESLYFLYSCTICVNCDVLTTSVMLRLLYNK